MAIFAKDTFAVVDLETTGTQREDNNHIIQFGCAIIKNMKVVKTYSFMINPHREIPLAVQNLTHIHNADVNTQKDFSYYAPKIIKILKDTVFVAHNVNFDLPFLNYELVQHGYEALTNRAIDTVELAKIAFPSLPSYKLTDLTSQLEIRHLNPHKADSDAYGTAVLLIKIIEKLKTLPQATLNTLSSLAHGLIRDTSWIFTTIADESRKQKRPLDKDCMQVRNIVLQKQKAHKNDGSQSAETSFPTTNKAKRVLFKGKINYRQPQVDLINHLNQFLEDPQKRTMLIEAPNGTGKTFSYLFAYSYRLYTSRKLVVATPTKVLQSQIIDQEIPQLLKVTQLDLTAELVKSSSHYLDLDGFYQSLYQGTPNKLTLVLQMRILVWLTETKTGDLDELQLTNYKAPLFAQITHPGDARVGSSFAAVDFWNLARQRQEKADILVTNHAYLANHYNDTIWGQNPYLVVDEAHRFVDNVISSRNDSFQFESLWGILNHLRNLLFYAEDSVFNQYGSDVQFNFLLEKLDPEILELIHVINELQKLLFSKRGKAVNKNILSNGDLLLSFEATDLFPKNGKFISKLTQFQRKLENVRQQTNEILFKLYNETDNSGAERDAVLSEVTSQIDSLDFYITKSYQLSDLLNTDGFKQEGFLVTLTNPQDPLSANLSWMMLDATNELKNIYERFNHIAFVSATLTSENDFSFITKQLALTNLHPQKYIGESTFRLADHLEVLAVQDLPDIASSQYDNILAQILENDLSKKDHVLVLMTNLDKIREVFSAILNSPSLRDFEVLAQGVSGSNHRITKRFAIAKRAIILGADSFWEGIDFHECSIDLVIAAKLPFESPDQPEVRLRQRQLTNQGVNVFQTDTIPRAVIRFRQGMGRLIRGEEDKGQFLILDSRFWSKDYGKVFLNAIPVKTQKISLKELRSKLDNYDKRRHKTNT